MKPRFRSARSVAAVLVVAAGTLVCSTPAIAADSDAPRGAPAQWLPQEEWVMEQWLPFDEQHLLDALRTTRRGLWAWVHTDRRTISQLATARGLDPAVLQAGLIDQRGAVDPQLVRELADRTRRLFTQPHLAHHVFFHEFHHWSVVANAPRIFGVPTSAEYERLFHHRYLAPGAIARRHHRTRAGVRRDVMAALDEAAGRGVAGGWMSIAQSRRLREHQLEAFDLWFRTTTGSPRPAARAALNSTRHLVCSIRPDVTAG